jgi:RHS repeat-associated protein
LSNAQSTAAYLYGDPNSGLKTADNVQLAYGGTIASTYSYDTNGRLHSSTADGLTTTSFDGTANLTAFTDNGGSASLTYDGRNQLQSMTKAGTTTVYGWDTTNGWRTSQGPSLNPTQITTTYTASGQLATYHNGASPVTDATYSYDANGQRTKRLVTVGGVTTTTNFTYDGITLMSLVTTQGSSSWRIDYLYDEEGNIYGGVYRSPANSSSPTYFTTVTSDRGDVVELLDAAGNPFAAYRYDAWGLPTATQTQGTALITSTLAGQIAGRQVLRYASYAYDTESGLYYCSARYYDSTTRQFTTADAAKADGEQSAYQYSAGDPVGNVDPTGANGKLFAPTRQGYNTDYFKTVLRVDAGWARCWLGPIGTIGWDWRGHQWDYKLYYGTSSYAKYDDIWWFLGNYISPDDFGNIHFGYTGRAAGYYLSWLKAASKKFNHSMSAAKEAKDEEFISWGYQLEGYWGFSFTYASWHTQFYYR